ncbi:MAG: exosortase/archaeosortase family protein [Opitutaceae bacterium]|nr:exosortase/archaeosortase family protein [Opitutaceae bacterium]
MPFAHPALVTSSAATAEAPRLTHRPRQGATAVEARAAGAALLAAAGGGLLLFLFPRLELGLFARGAAQLASLATGSPMLRAAAGWLLPSAQTPILVTTACSGADYFLIVAALLGWQLARRGRAVLRAALVGCALSLPFAITVNALRLTTLAQMHRWFIPLLPDVYAPFLHLLTGVAVFLPSLIALHLLIEFHGSHRPSP